MLNLARPAKYLRGAVFSGNLVALQLETRFPNMYITADVIQPQLVLA